MFALSRFVVLLMLCVAISSAAQVSVAVTANFSDLTGAAPSSPGFLRVQLQHCGTHTPRVLGAGILVTQSQDFAPNTAGLVSFNLWRNADIDCGGTQPTWYMVTPYAKGVQAGPAKAFIINAATNLNSASPCVTCGPVPPAPPAAAEWVRTNPVGSQTIVQPAGTTLNLSRVLLDANPTVPLGAATKQYADGVVAPDATAAVKGKVQLAGDLAGTADAPTVPGLTSKVPTTRTVAGKALSGDITIACADLSNDGDACTKNTGTAAGTVAAGDHNHSNTAIYPVVVSTHGITLGDGTSGSDGNAYSQNTYVTGNPANYGNIFDVKINGTSKLAVDGFGAIYSNGVALGAAATKNVGTTAGTVAAGDDSRIVNAVPNTRTVAGKALSSNVTLGCSDIGSGDACGKNTGTTAGTLAAGDDSRIVAGLVRQRGYQMGSDDAAAVLLDTADQATIFTCRWTACTLTSVTCQSDAGTPRIQLQKNTGAQVAILTDNANAGMDCSNLHAAPKGTLHASNKALAAGDTIDLQTVTAGGVAKRYIIEFTYTVTPPAVLP